MKSAGLKSLALWMFYCAFASVWIYGIWHTYTAHRTSAAVLALFFPPYGLYMAMESDTGHADANRASNRKGLLNAATEWCYQHPQTSRLNEAQQQVFCACFAEMFVDDLPPDLSFDPASPNYDISRINARIGNVAGSCMSSARYLGRGPERD